MSFIYIHVHNNMKKCMHANLVTFAPELELGKLSLHIAQTIL